MLGTLTNIVKRYLTPSVIIYTLFIIFFVAIFYNQGIVIGKQKRAISNLENRIDNLESDVSNLQNEVSDLENTQRTMMLFP